MSRTWTDALHEALAGADRLDIHDVVEGLAARSFADEWEPAWYGIGPDGAFAEEPVVRIAGAEKIADLLARIRVDDATSGSHCMCTGFPWLRFFRRGEEIASFTWHEVALRWHGGPWPGDGALTAESIAAVPAWLEAEGFPSLLRAKGERIAWQKRDRA